MRERMLTIGRAVGYERRPEWHRLGRLWRAIAYAVIPTLAASAVFAADDADSTRPAPTKATPPSELEQKRIGVQVHELFAVELAATSPQARHSAAQKLVDEADGDRIDDQTRFVLLSDALNLSVAAGDATGAWRALDDLEARFAIDGPAMKLDALQRIRKSGASLESCRIACPLALELADQFVTVDKYPDAERTLTLADALAVQSRDAYAMELTRKHTASVRSLESRYKSATTALKTLERNPKDPDANLTVGQYFCFVKRDWPRGLPYLAKGADGVLAQLAISDLAAPQDGKGQLALANQWWSSAERRAEPLRTSMLLRAANWYGQAKGQLTGLDQELAAKRLRAASDLASSSNAIPHRTVDLLRMINLKTDALEGDWVREGVAIKSGGRTNARIILRYEPPEEYDYTIVYTRLSGRDQVAQIFPVSDSQLAWSVGSWGKEMKLGARGRELAASEDSHCTDSGKEFTSIVKVRRGGIEVTLNGKKVAEYNGALTGLSSPSDSQLPSNKALGILTWYGDSQKFSRIELTEISGTGHPLAESR
jgi:hypothetical protein